MRTTYALLDDDPMFTAWLQSVVQKYHPLLTHVGSFSESVDAAKALTRLKPDILFLDMHLDCFNGLELLDILDYRPITIVVSASDDHKEEAERMGVLDYLTKPLSEQDFQIAMGRAFWLIRAREVQSQDSVKYSR